MNVLLECLRFIEMRQIKHDKTKAFLTNSRAKTAKAAKKTEIKLKNNKIKEKIKR